MINPRSALLSSHSLALGSRAGALIDTGHFSIKKGSICLVANDQIDGCKSLPVCKKFRFSAKGTVAAIQLGIDFTRRKSDICWLVLAWFGTFETGDRVLRDKLFKQVKAAQSSGR